MINKMNISIPHLSKLDTRTDAEIKQSNDSIAYLESLGVYFSLYTNQDVFPVHPDGVHTYVKDSREAKELVKHGKELPQELIDRLEYYKPLISGELIGKGD